MPRLDQTMVTRGLTSTRSQAENLIKLGFVKLKGKVTLKPGTLVMPKDEIVLTSKQQFVSRAALKLASVADRLNVTFRNKCVLDVGSSTGGFTEFALKNQAKKVIAVDVGTDQMHPNIRSNHRVELYEKTDIRDFIKRYKSKITSQESRVDLILADVSFISLREILPAIRTIMNDKTELLVMAKPQFEAGPSLTSRGVIKNNTIRRSVLKSLEEWFSQYFVIRGKADSEVQGAKGNRERFYLLSVKSLQKRP